MAFYDGETVRITATVTDFNGAAITSIPSATVSLYDTSGNYAFQNQTLTWSATFNYWYYDWAIALPGSWTAVCTFSGPNFEVFDYGKILVRSLKVVPTGLPTTITGQEDLNGG